MSFKHFSAVGTLSPCIQRVKIIPSRFVGHRKVQRQMHTSWEKKNRNWAPQQTEFFYGFAMKNCRAWMYNLHVLVSQIFLLSSFFFVRSSSLKCLKYKGWFLTQQWFQKRALLVGRVSTQNQFRHLENAYIKRNLVPMEKHGYFLTILFKQLTIIIGIKKVPFIL